MNPEDAAKAGYDVAIRLTDKTARTVWSIYTALIATNAFLISVAGFLAIRGVPWLPASMAVAALGLWVCFVWYRTTARTFAYYAFYFSWARHLEEMAFGETVRIARDGADFGGALGKSSVLKNGDGSDFSMAAPAKQFRVLRLVNSVIAAFALMYAVGLLVQGVSLINRIGA
jgi:hypothetical protein